MRLDKFLSETGTASRSESRKAARAGGISVNGDPVSDPSFPIDPEHDEVSYFGRRVHYQKYVYLMMNKPEGVISATDDISERTVLDLLPDKYRRLGLFPCGRLDKNTTGLLILTNNGALAHKLLSPKHHVKKSLPLHLRETALAGGLCSAGARRGYRRSPSDSAGKALPFRRLCG